MFWSLKHFLPPDMNTRSSKISTYLRCAICAAVALGGPPICDPTEKPSSSDIDSPFVSCWSATRLAIFAEVGCSRGRRERLSTDSFKRQISSLSKYDVLFPLSSTMARSRRVAVLKSVRENPHPVRALGHRGFSVVLLAFNISRVSFYDTRFQGAP